MAERVCPWWVGYLMASPVRRWMMNPESVVGRYIEPGMTILEPGPAMGFFTLPMAQMAGPSGRVVAVDIQPRMIDGLRRRAAKAGLSERVDARLAQADSLGIGDLKGKVDFVLAFAMVHEMPSAEAFFREAATALKSDGQLLLAEPEGHVNPARFAKEMDAARRAGLIKLERVAVRRSQAALFAKSPA